MSQFPQPVTQHEQLARKVGTWKVACQFFMDPTQPPMEVEATDRAEMHGAFFVQSIFEADMFGAAMRGISTMGYCPSSQKYQATWVDTFSPHLFYFEGEYDEGGKVLTMTGRAPAPGGGEITNWRTTETVVSDDEHIFEMFVEMPVVGEIKMLHYRYTRQA